MWRPFANSSFSDFSFTVPLVVPWLKMWLFYRYRYFTDVAQILKLLSKQFLYVTLTQNDDGIEGRDFMGAHPPNLLVVSGGGKGHIPFLLFALEINQSNGPMPSECQYLISFMGNLGSHRARARVARELRRNFGNGFYLGRSRNRTVWQTVAATSRFVLTPRGYGRNSFRLAEVLQMGMVPVYVYNDLIWLPYYDSIGWSNIAVVVHVDNLDPLYRVLKEASVSRVNEMRRKIAAMYNTHFSSRAAFEQLRLFVKFGTRKSDLRCTKWLHTRGA
jgi:hypothetical protein